MEVMIGGVSWWNNVSGIASRYTQLGTVRAYHGNWRTGSDTLTGKLDFYELYDLYYQTSSAVADVFPCLQGNYHGGQSGTGDNSESNKPIYVTGSNPIDPATYIVHGDNIYQWVARYGHNASMPDSVLRPAYNLMKGKGWINSIEDWNEPDQWWFGRNAYFPPYEIGA